MTGVQTCALPIYRVAGRQIIGPVLVLWGSEDDLADLYDHDVITVWRSWARGVIGRAVNSGHHLAEDAPQELAHALIDFFTDPTTRSVRERCPTRPEQT